MNPLVSSGHFRNEKERKTSGTVTGDKGGPHPVTIPETIAGHILL